MKGMLTTVEAARQLDISPGRVRQLIMEGRLPTEKVGRQHLIALRDLAAVRIRPNGRPRREKTGGRRG